MIPETATRTHIVCPKCADLMGSTDHLNIGATFGPWGCQSVDCNMGVQGKVTPDGLDVSFEEMAKKALLTLLKFGDAYIVVLDKYGVPYPDYYYHSHTCPVNIVNSAVGVFDPTGSDPHGIFRWVKSIDYNSEISKTLENTDSLQSLLLLFGTDGTPPETEWPEENHGMLPWIAGMRAQGIKDRSPKA